MSVTSQATNYPKLDPKLWYEKLIAFRTLKSDRKEVDRQAAELKKLSEGSRDLIVEALAGSPVAQCGSLMVTVKVGADSAASVTLRSGRKIMLADLKCLVLSDGTKITAADIAGLFGGRSGSTNVEVIG
jgi:hypothetical protein